MSNDTGGLLYQLRLAAAAVALAATAAFIIGRIHPAAIAEQKDEDDDPAHITATETVITHNDYLREITCDLRRSFQVMTQRKKCYSCAALLPGFLCRKLRRR